ncbi:MAG: hypothetical protein JWO06_319 [Bacteroidota bacterium]|nr:hypothetical protein [Bacteroidota bacterium]
MLSFGFVFIHLGFTSFSLPGVQPKNFMRLMVGYTTCYANGCGRWQIEAPLLFDTSFGISFTMKNAKKTVSEGNGFDAKSCTFL